MHMNGFLIIQPSKGHQFVKEKHFVVDSLSISRLALKRSENYLGVLFHS